MLILDDMLVHVLCVYVVCCERGGERERETWREREKERERDKEIKREHRTESTAAALALCRREIFKARSESMLSTLSRSV